MFTREDLDQLTEIVAEAWRRGLDRDWSARAGTLDWTCLKTADHTVDAVLAPAFFLASRRQDAYPEWASRPILMGTEARPEHLIEGLQIADRVLSAVIAAAPPETRAILRRRPVATGDLDDFAARGALEMILHAHDVCAGLQVFFEPPSDICERLREQTRPWPIWNRSPWMMPGATGDPWGDLLAATGRARVL